MIKIKIVLALLGALLAGTVSAQIYIPPVFGKDSLDTRSDELSRLYIPPKRIMWVSHDSLVQNKEVLLLSVMDNRSWGKGICVPCTPVGGIQPPFCWTTGVNCMED